MSVDAVLQSQAALLARLRLVVNSNGDAFDAHYLPVVRHLAAWVHLLPASACDHFAAPGGLFRYALDMGVHCLQAAQGCMFEPEVGAQARQAGAPRWRYASFLAGLLSPLPSALDALVVTGHDGVEWPSCEGSLSDWLCATAATGYHAGWHANQGLLRPPIPSTLSTRLLTAMVPADAMAWLREAGEGPLTELILVASSASDTATGTLAHLVESIRTRVLELDEVRRRHQGRPRCGHQLELHVVDAIRHRIESRRWQPMSDRGPLWVRGDAVYLEWPTAAEAIRHDIARSGVRGIPLAAATLADILGRAGLLTAAPSGGWLWRLPPDEPAEGECGAHRVALRLAVPHVFLGHDWALNGLSAGVESASHPAGLAEQQYHGTHPRLAHTSVRPPAMLQGGATLAPKPAHDALPPAIARRALNDPVRLPAAAARSVEVSRFVAHCQQALSERNERMVCRLPDGRLGVAATFPVKGGIDLHVLLAQLERLEWLGRVGGGRGGAPMGMLAMADGPALGFVLQADVLPRLGLGDGMTTCSG
ncbi:MobH family relaxase [Rhizobacter sp. LjRoot28]|uniref:MobH family relaxase n=1 Tax=Rhizobacter sp. LjRoot28 TaxID=3342309 RepID=UPI003ECEAAA2